MKADIFKTKTKFKTLSFQLDTPSLGNSKPGNNSRLVVQKLFILQM